MGGATLFPYEETVYETEDAPPSLESSARETLRTPQGRESFYGQLGPLGQRYVGALFGGGNKTEIDYVYGVYVDDNGTKLGNKQFDVRKDYSIVIGDTRYVGTPGLYELIFKMHPDDRVYTRYDLETYRNILLTTNAHRRSRSASMPIMGNKGHKYATIIGPLVRNDERTGAGARRRRTRIPFAMRAINNKVDYVHWDDPDELVNRLRLLDASRQAGNNAHDNEILSILEERREAGIIIN